MSWYVVRINDINYRVDTDKFEIYELKEEKIVPPAQKNELVIEALKVLKSEGKAI